MSEDPGPGRVGAASQPPAPQPDPFRLRGDPPRVVRLSRRALITLSSVSAILVGGGLIYALTPDHGRKTATELYNTDAHIPSDKLAGMPKDYSEVPRLGPPLPGDLGRPILAAQNGGKTVPVPEIGAPAGAQTNSSEANAAAQARQRVAQVREAARDSKLFASSAPSSSAVSIGDAGAPAPTPSPPASGRSETPDRNGQDAKRAFLAQVPDKRTTSPDRLAAPASPDILQAGSIIPAALLTGLRSDLPGEITAQVTSNVYDSPTGRTLLIPQGARLVGEYDSSVAFGQRRLLLAWTRLVLPDGRSIALERQPGTDAAGNTGLEDRVNNHWGQVFKAAILSTLLSVGSEAGTSQSENNLAQALRAGAANGFGQAGQQVVERQLNIQPTLTIRPGFPVRVMVTRDLVLEPWGE